MSDQQQTDVTLLPVAKKIELCLGSGSTSSTFQSHSSRNPALIFRLASDLIIRHKSSLSEAELYAVYEAGVCSACDVGQDKVATEWVARVLIPRFGRDSPRIKRLCGLCLEARGEFDEAQKQYDSVRAEHPLELWPIKRSAAIAKCQGRIGEAIAILESKNVFHDKSEEKHFPVRQLHPLDDGVMKELINLHWQNDSPDRALFYAEELLLLDPHNFLFFSRLGELCYATGYHERSITAYSQSVRLNPHANNCRAVFGLWQSCLEWRRNFLYGNNNNSSSSRGGASSKKIHSNNKKKKSKHQQQNSSSSPSASSVNDIDDDDENEDNNNDQDNEDNEGEGGMTSTQSITTQDYASEIDPSQTSASTKMTLPLVSTLVEIAEARLKQHYQNSPMQIVLDVTMRRYGGSK